MTTMSNFQIAARNISSPSMMKTSHDEPSYFSEAVAAINVRRPSLPARMPSGTAASSAMDSGEADSGYASHTSSPDSSKSQLIIGVAPLKGNRLWPLSPRKIVKLKPFDKPIPQLTQYRFQDLRELHADELNKLTRGLPRCQGILMSLTVLGESESTAEPWVFVQCDKAISRKIRNFFRQPAVRSDFQPAQPSSYSPYFEIYVCDLPPKLLVRNDESSPFPFHDILATNAVKVYSSGSEHDLSNTLCGTEVGVSTYGTVRTATIGGIIQVLNKDGGNTLFGMTAGHFLAQEQYEDDEEDQDEVSDDMDDDFSDEGESFELDMTSLNIEQVTASDAGLNEIKPVGKFENIPSSWPKIGHIHKTSCDDLQDQPNLDWALIAIENESFYLPNGIMGRDVSWISFTRRIGFERKVVLATAVSKSKSGTLSESWSYLMLAPGKSLTRTYLLTFSDTKALQPGDSGAWVIDDATNEVYGHVVASDAFGRAYVVPMEDIFLDIMDRIPAQAADLAYEYNMAKLDEIFSSRPQLSPICHRTHDIPMTNEALPYKRGRTYRKGASYTDRAQSSTPKIPGSRLNFKYSPRPPYISKSTHPDSGYGSLSSTASSSPQARAMPSRYGAQP